LQGISRRPPAEYQKIEMCRFLNQYLGTQLAPWEWAEVSEYWITLALVAEETARQLADVGG